METMSARPASGPAASFSRLPILRSVLYTPAHRDNSFRTYLPARTFFARADGLRRVSHGATEM